MKMAYNKNELIKLYIKINSNLKFQSKITVITIIINSFMYFTINQNVVV